MKRFGICLTLALLLIPIVCLGANDTTGTPVRIDTFGSDVVIASGPRPIKVKNITITAYTSAKTVTLIDSSNAVVLVLECPSGSTISWPPFTPSGDFRGIEFGNGLTFDDSASDLGAGDLVFIWKY